MLEDHKKFHFNLKNPKVITQGAIATQDKVSKWYLMYKLILGAYQKYYSLHYCKLAITCNLSFSL